MSANGLKILITDDDEDDVFLIKELIREGLGESVSVLDRAASFDDAISKLGSNDYNICLFDLRLGEKDGIELMRRFKGSGFVNPIIVLTGQGDQEMAVEAMKAGATDYLVKSQLSVEMLSHAIRNAIKIQNDFEQSKKAEVALQSQGNYLQALAQANNSLLTVRDHFKAVNEALSIMGKATYSDCVYIFQHRIGSGNIPLLCKYFSWSRGKRKFAKEDGEVKCYSYNQLGLFEVLTKMKNGHNAIVAMESPSEAACELFESEHIHSLFLIPIMLE
ncbi:MAG: response regulator, partial [Nitrospinaceae bacterium]